MKTSLWQTHYLVPDYLIVILQVKIYLLNVASAGTKGKGKKRQAHFGELFTASLAFSLHDSYYSPLLPFLKPPQLG